MRNCDKFMRYHIPSRLFRLSGSTLFSPWPPVAVAGGGGSAKSCWFPERRRRSSSIFRFSATTFLTVRAYWLFIHHAKSLGGPTQYGVLERWDRHQRSKWRDGEHAIFPLGAEQFQMGKKSQWIYITMQNCFRQFFPWVEWDSPSSFFASKFATRSFSDVIRCADLNFFQVFKARKFVQQMDWRSTAANFSRRLELQNMTRFKCDRCCASSREHWACAVCTCSFSPISALQEVLSSAQASCFGAL